MFGMIFKVKFQCKCFISLFHCSKLLVVRLPLFRHVDHITHTVYNSSYLLLTIEGGQEDKIFMDGNQVQGERVDIVDTSPHLVSITTTVSAGRHHIYHQSRDVKFGLYLYGTARGICAFSFVAGMCLQDIRPVGELYGNCPKYIRFRHTSGILVSETDYDVFNIE